MIIKFPIHRALALLLALPLSSLSRAAPVDVPAATVYSGGDIVTMAGDSPTYAEAVAVRDGKILFVGSQEGAVNAAGAGHASFDLDGRTMLPGFIEPHAHPVSIAAFILANDIVAPHPWTMPQRTYPGVSGKDNYLKAVADIVDGNNDKARTVSIWGYHAAWHGRLTLEDLDQATGDVPVMIYQRSTHEIYLNSAAFRKYGIQPSDVQTPDQADFANNHFWEKAYQEVKIARLMPLFADQEALRTGMDRLSQIMMMNGITTIAEPGFPTTNFDDEYAVLKYGTERAPYYSVYLIPGFPEQYALKMTTGDYVKRIESFPQKNTAQIEFLPGQYKIFADGAIYSLALQLTEPFYNCDWCVAEWIIPPPAQEQIFNQYWDLGYKIHIHITGDLAFQKSTDMVERAQLRNPRKDHRTTFHHVGYFTPEQAQRAAKLGVEFSANPYYLWALADKYGEIGLGLKRASHMVALHELTRWGSAVSLHSDFSMAPADPLELAWVAANRIVASGKTMAPQDKLSVYDAMKGVTISAARTLDLEDRIGSISAGKEATFTLLEQNPFKVDPVKLKDIVVDGTVYKGTYWQNTQAASASRVPGG
jgi:predicted amidohydrolase YtcJ